LTSGRYHRGVQIGDEFLNPHPGKRCFTETDA
jgi:hypothetical protein